jgi:hypothetical protein
VDPIPKVVVGERQAPLWMCRPKEWIAAFTYPLRYEIKKLQLINEYDER